MTGKRFNGGAPTILFDKGQPVLALGTPVGSRIVSALARALLTSFTTA